MAEGGSRQNKVYKAMNRPLTILGAERRLLSGQKMRHSQAVPVALFSL